MKTRRFSIVLFLGLASGPFACQSNTTDNFQNPPQGPPSTCVPSTTVPDCEGGSVGYVCSSDRPDDGDTNLVCDDGTTAALGMTAYCCAPYGQYWSDCTVDTTLAGCVGSSFGFRCTGPEGPGDADASLACSIGIASGTDTLYCCNSEVLPPACAADPMGTPCDGFAIGYSCAGSATPQGLDPNLACTSASAGHFCCTSVD